MRALRTSRVRRRPLSGDGGVALPDVRSSRATRVTHVRERWIPCLSLTCRLSIAGQCRPEASASQRRHATAPRARRALLTCWGELATV